MKRPKIRITLIDQKGTVGCHRGHKIGDSYDFDTERGNHGDACGISICRYPKIRRKHPGTGKRNSSICLSGCRYAECV